MRTLMMKKKAIELKELLPQIIDEWYREQGMETPKWQMKKPYFDEMGNIIRPD